MSAATRNSSALQYRPLDLARDEIRVLSIRRPRPRILNVIGDDMLECTLSHVALGDYSPEYAEFLELDGARMPPGPRSVLWSRIICPEKQIPDPRGETFSTIYQPYQPGVQQHARTGLGSDGQGEMVPIDVLVDKPAYKDKTRYNANCRRWTWGDFIALSYEWGDPRATSEIFVNGARKRVSKNLEAALRGIRRMLNSSSNQRVHVWADSLCINQDDIPERNAQVKRMKNIYSESSCVLVWTGAHLRRKSVLRQSGGIAAETMEAPHETRDLERLLAKRWFRRDVENVMMRTYWERLWIIQEILLASTNARVLFGDKSCLLSTWFEVYCAYVSAGVTDSPKYFSLDYVIRLGVLNDRYTEKYYYGSFPDLMGLLWLSRNAKQRDARDKIYAILGLVHSEIQALVVPDYDAPLLDVYRGFVRSVVKATGCLDIIFQGAAIPDRGPDFPSWVPDWRTSCPEDLIAVVDYKTFRAAGATVHDSSVEDDAGQITCRGVRIDAIYALGCSSGMPDVTHGPCDVSLAVASIPYSDVYGDDDGAGRAIWEALSLGRLASLTSRTQALLRAIPWCDGAAWLGQPDAFAPGTLYGFLACFQQCNRSILTAGKKETPQENRPHWSAGIDAGGLPGEEEAAADVVTLAGALWHRRFVATGRGYAGVAPKHARLGDLVFVLEGCNVPVALRPCRDGRYRLVGDCYVHGIMRGEALVGADGEGVEMETVTLC